MKTTTRTFLFAILITAILNIQAFAGHHGKETPVKKGILLVAFGSSMPEAQVSFKNIDANVKKSFADVPVYWAYTSSIIRKKLAGQGKNLDSVEMALARMMDQGFTHVAVQSLHTIRGEEFDDLEKTVSAFAHMPGGFAQIIVGNPLLTSQSDMEKVCKAVLANIPKDRNKNDALVLMGHGSPHPSNAFYAAMMFNLQRKDPNIFVGTVEGSPNIDDIAAMLKEKKIKKAWLVPFMSVAGDHARNDMAGDEDDSWKSILTKEKIVCVPVLKGTAEYDNMVAIWVDHLKEVMEHFK
ncbi:MAG: sirohydrochlorin cobaltochelatase [Desulfobacteraceae bacterium]